MGVLYFMIASSLLVALSFLAAFLWSVRTGQFDDVSTPALRILNDDPMPEPQPEP